MKKTLISVTCIMLIIMTSGKRPFARSSAMQAGKESPSVLVVNKHHPDASDDNPGTPDLPLMKISAAADMMEPGTQCVIHEGIYRETVSVKANGEADHPLIFRAAPGETAVMAGTEPIEGKWRKHRGNILVADVSFVFDQLFANGRMMVEARWPNTKPDQLLDRDTWAYAEEGAQHGWLKDRDLAESGLDATGAVAWLGVAHQFFSWSRKVTRHEKGDTLFTYPADLDGLASWETMEWPVQSGYLAPRYILMGKLEFLDQPGEWYLDEKEMKLYLWPPEGTHLDELSLEAKVRDLAFDVSGDHVQLSGLIFFGSTFRFSDCDYGLVENVHLLYPAYQRLFGSATDRAVVSSTSMRGNHHTIRNSSLAHSSVAGFNISGSNAHIEQTLVHDVCWNGSLRYTAISVNGGEEADGGAIVRHNTVYNGGNALMGIGSTPNNVVTFNHIHHGGKACKDVSLLYTQLPGVRGTVFSHNWVHDCDAPHIALGIRGDDQTRGLIVHHNVVWNIAWEGILVKGDDNLVYHNTCFNNDTDHDRYGDIMLYGTPEPVKPWRKQWPLLEEQNRNTRAFNNLGTIRGNRPYNPLPFPGEQFNNISGKEMDLDKLFADAENYDFRPVKRSPLIDAGAVPEGIEVDFEGEAPDIGAYEYGGDYWVPGCDESVEKAARKAEAVLKEILLKTIR